MIATLAKDILGTLQITYQGEAIDLTPPWKRVTMHGPGQRAYQPGLPMNFLAWKRPRPLCKT